MERLKVGDLKFGWRQWGEGDTTVLFIHGNLASKDWIELAAPHFPRGVRTIAVDWRGCGDSDKPAPAADFSNYSMEQHASDMLGVLDALGVSFCHLATHSTGGFIATRMLLRAPARFGRVLHLDPVSPLSLPFGQVEMDFFRKMMTDPAFTRLIMAGTAPALFEAYSLKPGHAPRFRLGKEENAGLFSRIMEQMFTLSPGVWLGTAHNLDLEHKSGEIGRRMGELNQPHLILWGELDQVIPFADLERMEKTLPDCRVVVAPGIGHSMNLENPELYAGYFGAWFGGLHR